MVDKWLYTPGKLGIITCDNLDVATALSVYKEYEFLTSTGSRAKEEEISKETVPGFASVPNFTFHIYTTLSSNTYQISGKNLRQQVPYSLPK